MAGSAGIGQSSANSNRCSDVTHAVVDARTLPLRPCKFPLKKLTTTTDSTESVAIDNEQRGVRSVNAAATSTDLLCQRLVNPSVYRVDRLGVVYHLRACGDGERRKYYQADGGCQWCR